MKTYGEKTYMERMVQRLSNPFQKKKEYFVIGSTRQMQKDLRKAGLVR